MAGYEIKAKKDIKIGEELFMHYNRSIVCGKCEAESDFYDLCFKKFKKCYFCGNMCLKLKKCSIVKPVLFVFSVMTKSRSHFKKISIMFKCIEWKAITSNDLIN
jgi:hypothetical protein